MGWWRLPAGTPYWTEGVAPAGATPIVASGVEALEQLIDAGQGGTPVGGEQVVVDDLSQLEQPVTGPAAGGDVDPEGDSERLDGHEGQR